MKSSVTIDEGQTKSETGKILLKWSHTLEEDDEKIKYHQIYYDIDKSISVLGEEENEKWIEINKEDLKDLPTINFLEYFHTFLKDCKKRKADSLEELKKFLNKVNIKFEEGDWQSFPDNFNETPRKKAKPKKAKPLPKPRTQNLFDPILSNRQVLKLFNLIDDYKIILIIYAIIFAVSFKFSLLVFGFILFSLLGLGSLFLVFDAIREKKTFLSFIVSAPYLLVGLYCLYLAYTSIIELLI
jgi:hypothetical protein